MGRFVSATSNNAWAVLTEGVASARIEAHRIHQHLSDIMAMVHESPAKDRIYQMAGDSILAVPKHMEQLERHLDRTGYALSVLGKDVIRDTLSVADRKEVDEAMDSVTPMVQRMARKVATRYLQSDLNPPLGVPGGPCQVLRRIEENVRNPALKEELKDDVERGLKIENADAAKIYRLENEHGVGKIREFSISPHAQYRMDQRSVTVQDVRNNLASFLKVWNDERSKKSPLGKRWDQDMAYGESIEYVDKKTKLLTVFKMVRDTAVIITTYWEGKPDPKGVRETSCKL